MTKKRSHLVNLNGEAIPNDALERIVPVGSEQFREIYDKIDLEIREKKVGSRRHGSGSLHVNEELSIPVAVPGVTSADIELLIRKCSFLAGWYKDPTGTPYDAWLGLGLGSNLHALGVAGDAAWRDLSGRDSIGWDEDIFNVKLNEEIPRLHPYSCEALGCDGHCGVRFPIDHVLGPRYIILDGKERKKEITLRSARNRLSKYYDKMLKADDSDIHLIKTPPGVGKTEMLARKVAKKNEEEGMSCLWLTSSHKQAEQVLKIFPNAVHLKSRE